MKGTSISPEWEAAAENVSQETGIFLVVGVPDSGKSTLSRFLVGYLANAGRRVALIDCDVGQSILGPPTTMGMVIYTEPIEQVDTLEPDCMRFIGASSPVGHLPETVVGAKKMADKALNEQAEVVVINTSGLILGVPGTELKLSKVDLLCPKCVLALQASSEIELLLSYLEKRPTLSVVRLPISDYARKRSPDVRRGLREEKYRQYFQQSRIAKMPLSQMVPQRQLLSRDRNVPIDALKNLLFGLCDSEDYLLALGILQDLDLADESLHILTPLRPEDEEKVAKIQVGEIKVHPDGQEQYVGRGLPF